MSEEPDSFKLLREEFGEESWILACENSWNYAYAPAALQDRVDGIIKAERKEQKYEPENSTDTE